MLLMHFNYYYNHRNEIIFYQQSFIVLSGVVVVPRQNRGQPNPKGHKTGTQCVLHYFFSTTDFNLIINLVLLLTFIE